MVGLRWSFITRADAQADGPRKTRRLAAKVFQGPQVHCPARTSAQFDEPSPVRKVWSLVFAQPPSEIASKANVAETASPKREGMEDEAVGETQRWTWTQTGIQWHECAITKRVTMMK